MTVPTRSKRSFRPAASLVGIFLMGMVIMAGIAALLINIQERKDEAKDFPLQVVSIADNELDPAVWGKNFPREYNSFMKTQDDTIQTPHGGSVPYSKLALYPAMIRIYAGYAFSVDYNHARGHYYALIDQIKTKRQQFTKQPATCANCHAAEAPQLIQQMGWEAFSHTAYSDIQDKLHTATSCADCHTPNTMDLRITRPAFINAMKARGIDLTKATRQEMRTYVCAQCHVEYYFQGANKLLTFPWSKGLNIDDIEKYYNEPVFEIANSTSKGPFKDWVHKETGAPMLKMQHPEFEMWSSGIHAQSGVSCADCHMPYVRDGSVKVSDHWLRSPLTDLNNACQTCHKIDEADLKQRIVNIQDKTAKLTRDTESALIDAIDAIDAARAAGAGDAELQQALDLQRRATMRWDFVSSENSTGFHSPQEAARILADAINFARQAQVAAVQVTAKRTATVSFR